MTMPDHVRAAIQAWADEHMVGRPATRESLEFFRAGCTRVISELHDVEPECVALEGARIEQNAAGATMRVDGYRLVDPRPRRRTDGPERPD